jgi:transcriptional regulator with XRE-family HTH domain
MERIRSLRKEAKITQDQLAQELCVSQETISGYENTKTYPPAHMLMQLADTFHTTVDYLLERTDNRSPNGLWESQLTEQESELVFFYRKLTGAQRERVIGYVLGIMDNEAAI